MEDQVYGMVTKRIQPPKLMFKPKRGEINRIILVYFMGEPNILQPVCFLDPRILVKIGIVIPDKTIAKGWGID